MINPRLIAIASALLILFFVIELIRKQKMTFKYSAFWLGGSILVVFFSIYDNVLRALAGLAGFQLPSNFVFFLLLVFFTLLSLFLTRYINEQNNRLEALTQAIAILEHRTKKLETQNDKPAKHDH